jgi:hypothetical protein
VRTNTNRRNYSGLHLHEEEEKVSTNKRYNHAGNDLWPPFDKPRTGFDWAHLCLRHWRRQDRLSRPMPVRLLVQMKTAVESELPFFTSTLSCS